MSHDEFNELVLAIESVFAQPTGSAANKIAPPSIMRNLRGDKGAEAVRRRKSIKMLSRVKALVLAHERDNLQPHKNLRSVTWLTHKDEVMEFTLQAPCRSCAGTGTLSQDASKLSFVCDACSHRVNKSFERGSVDTCCDCAFCLKYKLAFSKTLQSVFKEIVESVMASYTTWLDDLHAVESRRMSQQSMERDHLQRQNELSKDLRGVLAFKPTSGEDFRDCIHRYTRGDAAFERQIESSAPELGVIYRKYESPAFADSAELLSFAVTPLLSLAVLRHRALVLDRSLGEQQVEEELSAFAKTVSARIVASLFSFDGIAAPLHLSRAGVDLILDGERIEIFRARYED